MDIRKNRLIKQCKIILGEDFDQDFIYEDIDFNSPTKIWEAYLEYVILNEKQIAGLVKKSEKSGISYGILKKVYDRGMAAWKTGHRPGTTPQQWAFARVNSFITGGKTRTTADADLWAKHKGKKEDLEEAMKFWKVTITKKAGKLFKGQNVVTKARNSAEAIKKGIKQMKGNPALVPGGSVTAELDESNGK